MKELERTGVHSIVCFTILHRNTAKQQQARLHQPLASQPLHHYPLSQQRKHQSQHWEGQHHHLVFLLSLSLYQLLHLQQHNGTYIALSLQPMYHSWVTLHLLPRSVRRNYPSNQNLYLHPLRHSDICIVLSLPPMCHLLHL